MSKSRRSFLNKIGLGALASALTPAMLLANKSTDTIWTTTNKKPLGFQWETKDPFLFCVHHEDFFPEGNNQLGPKGSLEGRSIGSDFVIKDGFRMYHGKKVPGFPGHPHRGFETITAVRKGMVDHSDSMGASGRYGNGDVQWMTAGAGVNHAEMFPLLDSNKPNTLELFQIWLNLPSKNKMVTPSYRMLWNKQIPIINHIDNNNRKTSIEVIAGRIGDECAPAPTPNSWAADADNEVAIWNIKMEEEATYPLPKTIYGVDRTLYLYEGDGIGIEGASIENYHSVELNPEQTMTIINKGKSASILILQGKPIGEPVVQHGPFVMNTKQEIEQTFIDYQKTSFGGWPWATYEQVHDRELGRFAKYADGSEDVPD